MGEALTVEWLGLVPYGEALALQEAAGARSRGRPSPAIGCCCSSIRP